MLRLVKICAVAVVAALASLSAANAGMIPIPCTGEKIIKVADFHDMTRPDGTRIDLGYLFQGCFSGKWIGYVGSTSSYLNLPDGVVEVLALSRGLTAMPPVPGFWSSAWANKWQFGTEWAWMVIVGFLGCVAILRKLGGLDGEDGTTPPADVTIADRAPTAPVNQTVVPTGGSAPAPEHMARTLARKVAETSATPEFGKR